MDLWWLLRSWSIESSICSLLIILLFRNVDWNWWGKWFFLNCRFSWFNLLYRQFFNFIRSCFKDWYCTSNITMNINTHLFVRDLIWYLFLLLSLRWIRFIVETFLGFLRLIFHNSLSKRHLGWPLLLRNLRRSLWLRKNVSRGFGRSCLFQGIRYKTFLWFNLRRWPFGKCNGFTLSWSWTPHTFKVYYNIWKAIW